MTAKDAYTVSEVNHYIAGMFDGDPFLNHVRILGEISRITVQSGSGHMYFALKDDRSVIDAKMWKGTQRSLTFLPKQGDKVIVTGAVDVFEKSGRYSITVSKMEKAGAGDIYQRLLELKRELAEMGMFDAQYKRPIPKYSMRIGVVTAASGAVIHDIYVNVKKKNPYAEIVLYPTLVQGEGAAENIAKGIQTLDSMGFDVIIVGRGGGSVEDLWAFNERVVADAIFASDTPIISAVGHEIDSSISNLVADMAVSTPTAAAEAATFSYEEFLADLSDRRQDLGRRMEHALRDANNRLGSYGTALSAKSPRARIKLYRQRFVSLYDRLLSTMETGENQARQKLALYSTRLDEMSPLKRMAAGYGFVQKADGSRLKSVRDVQVAEEIRLHLSDGSLKANITEIKEER